MLGNCRPVAAAESAVIGHMLAALPVDSFVPWLELESAALAQVLHRAVSQYKLFCSGVEQFGESDDIGIDYACIAFFQISVCGKGNIQSVSQFFLGEFPCLSDLADIVFYRRIVHFHSVRQDKIIGYADVH